MRRAHRLALSPIVALSLLLSVAGPALAQDVCACDDIAQMQYRVDEDNAAIDAYMRYEATVPHNVFATSGAQAKLQTFVQTAMDAFANKPDQLSSPLHGGEQANTRCIDGKGVTTWPRYGMEPTPCLKRALELHEASHRRRCDEAFDMPLVGKTRVLLTSYIAEEIDAYSAEVTFLEHEKKRLICNCDYYSVRFAATLTGDWQKGSFHQVNNWRLTSAAGDFVVIPLTLNDGAFSGDGKGQLKLVDTLNTTPEHVNCRSTGVMDESYAVSGRMSKALQLKLASTVTNLSSSGDCTTLLGTNRTSQSRSPNATSERSLQFAKLDDPVRQEVTQTDLYGGATFEATLIVSDKWQNRKAANGRGSTVGEALRRIGFVDC